MATAGPKNPHETSLRIYYKDTDAAGVVYYGRYCDFFEVGRTELFRSLGVAASDLAKEHGIVLPVVDLGVRYRRPLRYNDLILVRTWVRTWTPIRIHFEYEIATQQEQQQQQKTLACSGHTINASVDVSTGKPIRLPESLSSVLGSL